jgi:hypothetical protein
MATVVKLKVKSAKPSVKMTPLQKKLLEAPLLSKKQIRLIEEAGKLIGKWKI